MRKFVAPLLAGFLLLLTSCGEDTADEAAIGPAPAHWTLEEDLRIDEEEEYYLGRVGSVVVRSDGVLFVADPEEQHVKVISPEGKLLETIGREGEGPGEFRRPHQVALARGDSLFVVDAQRRLSVFAPESYDFVRSFTIESEDSQYPMEMRVPLDGGFLITYLIPPVLGEEPDPALYLVGDDGVQLKLVDIPQQGRERIRIEANRRVMVIDKPFARRSVVALGPEGRLYHGMTDSLAITVSDLAGNTLDHWALPAKPRPVTDGDLHAVEEDRSAEVVEAIREADLPDTHPAFYDLLVDDRQRVWIRRASDRQETATWWVASAEGELLAELELPSHVQLEAVHEGYAYGMIRSEEELPSVIRYRIEEDS